MGDLHESLKLGLVSGTLVALVKSGAELLLVKHSAPWTSRVAQRSKALHCSARNITTDLGSIPGCVTASRDRETHEAAHNCPSITWVRGGLTLHSSASCGGLPSVVRCTVFPLTQWCGWLPC